MIDDAFFEGMPARGADQLRPLIAQVTRDPTAALERMRAMVGSSTQSETAWRCAISMAAGMSQEAADVLLSGGAFDLAVKAVVGATKRQAGSHCWGNLGSLLTMAEPLSARKDLLESTSLQQALHDLIDALWADLRCRPRARS